MPQNAALLFSKMKSTMNICTLLAFLAGFAQAQYVNCIEISQETGEAQEHPECCWVVRSWQMMGQTIPSHISPTDNSCCSNSMDGVTCDPSNTTVTELNWMSRGLSGSFPKDIGNLINLQTL